MCESFVMIYYERNCIKWLRFSSNACFSSAVKGKIYVNHVSCTLEFLSFLHFLLGGLYILFIEGFFLASSLFFLCHLTYFIFFYHHVLWETCISNTYYVKGLRFDIYYIVLCFYMRTLLCNTNYTSFGSYHLLILLFPYGEDDYRHDSIIIKPTIMEWFSFRIQTRESKAMTFLRSKRLFQQFVVDGYTMIESKRLSLIRNNLSKLKVDKYNSLSKPTNETQNEG